MDLVKLYEKWDRLAELQFDTQRPIESPHHLNLSDSESYILSVELQEACINYHMALCQDCENRIGYVPEWAEKALARAKRGDELALMGRFKKC